MLGLLGWFSYDVAKDSASQKEYENLTFVANEVVLEKVNSKYDLLVRTGLNSVPAFVQSYQQELFSEMTHLSQISEKSFTIVDHNTNKVLYSSDNIADKIADKIATNTVDKSDNTFNTINPEHHNHLNNITPAQGVLITQDNLIYYAVNFAPWNWDIYVTVSTDTITTPLNSIRLLALSAVILATFISLGFLNYYVNRVIIKPINVLQNAAKDISTNKAHVDINLDSQDELNTLAHSIEIMSQEIEHHIQRAEDASKAKTEFLATMSHEIRTPLNGIMGMTKILQETPLNDKQVEMVNALYQSSRTLSGILNDVLDLSKIEAGKLLVEKTKLFTHDLTDNINVVFNHLSSENRTILTCSNRIPLNIVLLTDAIRVRQIVFNIVGNAVKFTQHGSIDITFDITDDNGDTSSSNEENNKHYLHFSCEDTGIGIDEKRLEAVFDSFTQSDNSTTRQYGGSGLGLSIVKQLVDLLDGTVSVKSQVGEGTRFDVVIPVEVLEAEASDFDILENDKVAKLSDLTLLLVEDNEINSIVAKNFIEKHGHKVIVAANGEEAVEAANGFKFDAILMDIHMPVMDGIEATQIIRSFSDSEKARVPIIGLTAEAFEQRHQSFIAAGMNAIVTKPVDESHLVNAIYKAISQA